jgi:ribosomal protein S10
MINIKVQAKSYKKKAINCFLKETKNIENIKINNILYKKEFKNFKRTKKFSLLKSPHVNKNAQEQFEFRTFILTNFFYAINVDNFFNLIKEINKNKYPEISLKINIVLSKKKFIDKKIASLNNIKLDFFLTKINSRKKEIKNYLNILDFGGELFLDIKCLSSSVVEQRTENPCDGSSILPLNKKYKK